MVDPLTDIPVLLTKNPDEDVRAHALQRLPMPTTKPAGRNQPRRTTIRILTDITATVTDGRDTPGGLVELLPANGTPAPYSPASNSRLAADPPQMPADSQWWLS